jgi:hypothetical protein
MAASVAASWPALSVPVAGGPTVPVCTVKLAERDPDAVVVLMAKRGFVHETGAGLPATSIVGCPGALLHSRMAPVALTGKPDAVTVTEAPLVSPVLGEAPTVAVADAGLANASTPTMLETKSAAVAKASRTSFRSRRIFCVPPGLSPSPQLSPHTNRRTSPPTGTPVQRR